MNNFKLTNQRLVILDFIKENFKHPSVEEIYSYTKKKLPRVSKKTVYTNLKFLVSQGLISEVNVKGVLRYEPLLKAHHHLICKKCDRIIDYKSDKLLKYSMSVAKNIKDFDIQSTATNFYGICNKCKKK